MNETMKEDFLVSIVLKIESGIELTNEEKEFLYSTPLYPRKICKKLIEIRGWLFGRKILLHGIQKWNTGIFGWPFEKWR